MKSFSFLALFMTCFLHISAQLVIDFEDLTVPQTGYFNGATIHSGNIGNTEKFEYQSVSGLFRVYYTKENGYNYWSGTAYSNQKDMLTADWNNFSAYTVDGSGGADNSTNYAFGYMWNPTFAQPFSDTISFDRPICCDIEIEGMYVTNAVWTYHYMNGTDGTGTGKYSAGDYYKLIFRGLDINNNYNGQEVEFYLADFTNNNAYIIDKWTWVNLSALNGSDKIAILYYSSDEWTPSYYCIDNITIDYINNIENEQFNNVEIYPNPAKDFITIKNIAETDIKIYDICGKLVIYNYLDQTNQKIDVSSLKTGIYFVTLKQDNRLIYKKIVIL